MCASHKCGPEDRAQITLPFLGNACGLVFRGKPQSRQQWWGTFHMTNVRRTFLATASAVALLTTQSTGTLAQDQQPAASGPVEKVTVTGSRIKRPEYSRLLPTQSVTGDTIDARGQTNLADALNEIPAFGFGAPPQGNQQSFGAGQSYVDLFDMGTQRTLTLVNGRRFISSNQASLFVAGNAPGLQVDFNVLPTALVDRIEVVAVGGAATYGADAIAGTVNVILKDDFEGIEVDPQYNIGESGDGENYRVRGTAGLNFDEGRGNIVVAGEYNLVEGQLFTEKYLTALQRVYTSNPLNSTAFGNPLPVSSNGVPDNVLLDNRRLPLLTVGGAVTPAIASGLTLSNNSTTTVLRNTGATTALNDHLFLQACPNATLEAINPGYGWFRVASTDACTLAQAGRAASKAVPLRFDGTGNLIQYNPGEIAFGKPLSATTGSGGDGLNLAPLTNLQTDQKRMIANTLGHYDLIPDAMRFTFEGTFAHVENEEVANQPTFNTSIFGTTSSHLTFSTTNPFLSAQNLATLASVGVGGVGQPTTFRLQRAHDDLMSGNKVTAELDLYRVAAAFEGDLELLGLATSYELGYLYGKSESLNTSFSLLNTEFNLAIDAASDAGTVKCRAQFDPVAQAAALAAGATMAQITACRPLNLFGENRFSAEAQSYVVGKFEAENETSQSDLFGNVQVDLLQLPAGPLAVGMGFEVRTEDIMFVPDAASIAGLGRSAPLVVTQGEYTSKEYYGEFLLPIFSPEMERPMAHLLEIEGAYRDIDVDITGPAKAWTLGGRWAPWDWLTLRGNKTFSIRAPSLTELFLGPQTSFASVGDPCHNGNIGGGPNPTARRANCRAAVIAAGLAADNASADTFLAGFISNAVSASVQGVNRGSPTLVNEEAEAHTVGIILQPHWLLKNLSIAADYYKIDLTNTIESVTATQLITACFDSTVFAPLSPDCAAVVRLPTFQITTFASGFKNLGFRNFEGGSVSLDYRLALEDVGLQAAGDDVAISVSWFHLDTLEFSTNGLLSGLTVLDGEWGDSQDEIAVNLRYSNGPFNALLNWQYQSSALWDAQGSAEFRSILGPDAYSLTNLSLTYDVTEQVQARFVINNLFDVDPPFGTQGGDAIGVYDVFGRRFGIGMQAKF